MTFTRGFALLLTVAAAGALVDASAPGAAVGGRIKTITSRANAKGASLVIEATEPVAYVATAPDPLTVVLDLRNVIADGAANSVTANHTSPIASVSIEAADDLRGAPASRVRIALAQPVAHHIRSERNTIVIDFDKPSAKPLPYVLPPVAAAPVKGSAPDAMLALQQVEATRVDPIRALGLDTVRSAPLSAATPAGPVSVPALAVPASTTITTSAPSAIVLTGPPAPPAAVPSAGATAVRALESASPQFATQPPTPPPPTSTQTPQQFGSATQDLRYTGHPISLDFQGADLRAVLRTFAEISGLNMVIDPTVTGTVDVALRDVPWDQALDLILRANKLGYLVEGTIVRIAPLSVLADEEGGRRKLSDERALAGTLDVLTQTLSYAKAAELEVLLTKSALSPRGTVQVDPRTNTIIITDLPDRLTTAKALITTLDRAQPQVEIEARIVQTNKAYARALGVQWGFAGRVDPTLGNTTGLAFPNNGSLSGRTGGTQGPAVPGAAGTPATAVNLGVGGASSAVGLALGSINGALNLDVALTALETSGNGRLLSTPRVTTQNNIAAEITQGVQIPIQTVSNNTVTVSFKDAALTLRVTPQITAANTVIMLISVENASPDFSRAVGGIPPINTQRANTQVLVSDGQTTVIGGIYVSSEQAQTDRTPGLGQIPLLRWLFKRDSVTDTNTELLIFITPRIIKS